MTLSKLRPRGSEIRNRGWREPLMDAPHWLLMVKRRSLIEDVHEHPIIDHTGKTRAILIPCTPLIGIGKVFVKIMKSNNAVYSQCNNNATNILRVRRKRILKTYSDSKLSGLQQRHKTRRDKRMQERRQQVLFMSLK